MLVDSHVHLWSTREPGLRYPWVETGSNPIAGDIRAIITEVYDAAALRMETADAGVGKIVLVEAGAHPDDVVAETRWAQSQAELTGWPNAMVGKIVLGAQTLREQLERHLEYPVFVGVRAADLDAYLAQAEQDTTIERGIALLAELDLVCELRCAWTSLGQAARLAARQGATQFVLEHLGFAPSDPASWRQWRSGIAGLARLENVSCKLSGFGLVSLEWSTDQLRPLVEFCLERFGAGRCIYGSNWPVDRRAASYDETVAAFLEWVSDLSESEQHAIGGGNAEQLYSI